MTRFALVGTRIALGAAVVAVVLGVSGTGAAQEQFDKELGVDAATRETTEVVPAAEAAAGIKPATGTGTAATGVGTTGSATAGAATGGEPYATPASPTSPAMDAARAAIWNGPEMMTAREYITEYGRRSRQFNSAAAESYLTRLSQFTPDEMKAWLERYAARRAAEQRNYEVSRAARQTAIASNQQRLQAIEQARQAANQWQSEAALTARMQYATTQQNAQTAGQIKSLNRDMYLGALQAGNAYDYFVNPPYYVRAAAASMLPGDLPAGDPRNYMREPPVPGGGGGLSEAAASAVERAGGKGR